jgi:type I restriction-modification system DNA methylase subunit
MKESEKSKNTTQILVEQIEEALSILIIGYDRANAVSKNSFDKEIPTTKLYDVLTDTLLHVIFLLFLEDKDLLPTTKRTSKNQVSSVRSLIQKIEDNYRHSSSGMFETYDAWEKLHLVFGVMFNEHDTSDEESYPFQTKYVGEVSLSNIPQNLFQVDDFCVYEMLKKLVYIKEKKPLSYQNMEVEILGSMYEALMDLRIERRDIIGGHSIQRSSKRRNTGSHYTPRALSKLIVHRTIDPLIDKNPTVQDILCLKICDPAMGTGMFLIEVCRYLSKKLVEVWSRTDKYPKGESDNWNLVAMRLIAKQCLYGVDKNPKAVQLARWSIWIVMNEQNLSFSFLDHNLKYGDAIVGCSKEQIASFDRLESEIDKKFLNSVNEAIQFSMKYRIHFGSKVVGNETFDGSQNIVERERSIGDLLIACVWAGGSKGQVKKRIARIREEVKNQHVDEDWTFSKEATSLLHNLYGGRFGFKPFHWELEFPEVFFPIDREQGGFDAILGNPPYMGKVTTAASNGKEYIKILQQKWTHAHGQSDICAFFFLQTANILRKQGCFGLIATNSIGQGNTRQTGLQHMICTSEIELYNVTTNMIWPVPGAIVSVSIIHGIQGEWKKGQKFIDGEEVLWINSELRGLPELPNVISIQKNAYLSFQGTIVNCTSPGFVLQQSEFHQLLAKNASYKDCIQPYMGGLELNSSPTLDFSRYIINFTSKTLEQAKQYPDLFLHVKEHVFSIRQSQNKISNRDFWWLYEAPRPNLYQAIGLLQRCLCCSAVSKYLLFGFQPTSQIFSHALILFAFDDYKSFAILQSQVHEFWARMMGSSMKNDPRYTPSSCFQTFPFPTSNPTSDQQMEDLGRNLYTLRSNYMKKHHIGMTETWNRLMKESNEYYHSKDIKNIRQSRYDMDKSVLQAYGWDDLEPIDHQEIITRLRHLNFCRVLDEVLDEQKFVKDILKRATENVQNSNVIKENHVQKIQIKYLKIIKKEVNKVQLLIQLFSQNSVHEMNEASRKSIFQASSKIREVFHEIEKGK